METQVILYTVSCTVIGTSTGGLQSVTTGMAAGSKIGAPISTLAPTATPSCTRMSMVLTAPMDAMVTVVLSVSLWSYTYFATQRIPLPHIAPREPSALYITISKSAFCPFSMRMMPSPPMPKCRSESRTAS